MNTRNLYYITFLLWILRPAVGFAIEPFQFPSPDGQYSLIITETRSPDSRDVVRRSFSISDSASNTTKSLGASEYPLIAVKWHRSAKSLIILEHISRQTVMRIITLKVKEWQMAEVIQFPDTPNYFSILNIRSLDSSFFCYYLGRNSTRDPFTAYRTEVSIYDERAKVLSSTIVSDENLEFYRPSISGMVHLFKKTIKDNPTQLFIDPADEEPGWYITPQDD